jgi:hypothetical protein
MPKIIQVYNSYVGSVDLLDKQISLRHIRIKSKKWWWPLLTQMLDVAVASARRAYQTANKEQSSIIRCTQRERLLA